MQSETNKLQFSVLAKHTTHSGGRGEVLHDWYPYLEGYSSEFVQKVIEHYLPNASLVLEPFAGVGTTPLTLNSLGIDCAFCEVNPAMQRIITSKLNAAALSPSARATLSTQLEDIACSLDEVLKKHRPCKELKNAYGNAFGASTFFTSDNFHQVLTFRSYIDSIAEADTQLADILEVAGMACLIKCSMLRRAGDLRFKTPKELTKSTERFSDAVKKQLDLMIKDILTIKESHRGKSFLASNDARQITDLKVKADGVITSPPYLNGTNYFRNTKLELWFSKQLRTSSCLRKFRDSVITSGINDVAKSKNIAVMPFLSGLVSQLSDNAYDQRIPKMVAGYFQDMQLVFKGIFNNLKPRGLVCLDIGDSIYSGVHVRTDKLLIELAEQNGFSAIEDIMLRQRRSKGGQVLSQKLLILEKQ